MAKPMEFTMVSAVPLISGEAFLATNVENKGESATTTIPQKLKNAIRTTTEDWRKIKGKLMQHKPDRNRAVAAVRFTPTISEI